MTKVLLADDHKVLLESMVMMFEGVEGIQCVGTVSDGAAALDFVREHEVNVVLMDINMPKMDGLEATKLIKAEKPEVQIIGLTMLDQGSFIQQMLKNGASGFLLKNAGKEDVLNAIRAVAVGGQFLGPEATQLLINNMKGQQAAKQSFMPQLTRREKEVLGLVSEGFSSQQIADKLHISFNTVESHRKNLNSKFGARNGADLVRMAAERGLL